VIDKEGIVRYVNVNDPRALPPADEMLGIVEKYK